MNTAERLAREIARVAELRGRCLQALIPPHAHGVVVHDAMGPAIELACQAIGSGDDGRMEAAGFNLKDLVE
jgi:hypothetical protein